MTDQNVQTNEPVTTTGEEPTTKRKFKLWQRVAMGIVGFFVLIFTVVTFATAGVTKASNGFVNAILQNDATTAYAYFSSDAREVVNKDEFASIVTTMSSILGDKASQKSKSVESSTGSGSKGTVVYNISGSDGAYELTVNMVKENDEWKVLNFDNVRNK